jgi:hypothetical protein
MRHATPLARLRGTIGAVAAIAAFHRYQAEGREWARMSIQNCVTPWRHLPPSGQQRPLMDELLAIQAMPI